MALKGTLKDFALPDIFQLISMQRKTGLLTLENDRETVTVVFDNGMVVHADSSVRRLDDLLGHVLVQQQKLTKDTLEDALARQRVSMQRLGYILTTQGYIEPKDLREALTAQMQQIVFRIFRWKQGQYHFDPSPNVDYDRENVAPMSADQILMEGIRRVDEWPIIEKRIPSLDAVFKPLVPRNQIQIGKESSSDGGLEAVLGQLDGRRKAAPSGSWEVVLTQSEARIYSLLDGRTSLARIVESTGMSDFEVCRILFDFLDRHLVAPATPPHGVEEKPPTLSSASHPSPPASLGAAVLGLVLVGAGFGLFLSITTRAPFRVPVLESSFWTEWETTREATSVARLRRIDAALRVFYSSHRQFPELLDDLLREQPMLVAPRDLLDSRGRPFEYEPGKESVKLFLKGDSGERVLAYELGY